MDADDRKYHGSMPDRIQVPDNSGKLLGLIDWVMIILMLVATLLVIAYLGIG